MKNKTYILILPLFLFFFSCQKEKKVTEYSPLSKAEMITDFGVFQSIFEAANSGLYKYHSKEEIDSVFAANKNQITEGTSFRAYYNLLWNVIDFSGSCHNTLSYPDSLDNALNQQKIFFPLPLKCIDKKLHVDLAHKTMPAGSELLSINGIEAQQFLADVSKYVSTDGNNTTGKHANMETDWLPFYIYLAYGKQERFTLKYKTGSHSIAEIQLPGCTYHDFYNNYKNRLSEKSNTSNNDYSYVFIDSLNSGILTVKTFAFGSPKSKEQSIYASFLDSVFTDLGQKNAQALLLDVRGNGGGSDPNDLLLYSYLTQRTFRENTSAFTLFNKVPFPKHYMDDDLAELTEELKEEHSVLKDGKYFQHPSFNKIWLPNKKAFRGKVFMLIDPFVASAGSLFASLVKSDSTSVVIGEETLGGYYGHTGHIPVNYKLPYSQFTLSFSIVDLEQDVAVLPDENYGDGVQPDYRVIPSYQDLMENKDVQLDFALEKVKEIVLK